MKGRNKKQFSIPKRVLCTEVPWVKKFNPKGFVYVPCNICGTFHFETLASIVINIFEFFIVQCPNCSLIWRNPLPDETFLNELYSDQYYKVKEYAPNITSQVGIADSEEVDVKRRDEIAHNEVQSWIMKGITPKDKNDQPKKFLEIGGGRGYLQYAAQKKGWQTCGLEVSPHGFKSAISRNLMILPFTLSKFSEYLPYSNYFDLIVFFDLLEHVNDPSQLLRLINLILKDDGIIIFRIPMTVEYPKLHLIDHIWHFTSNNVQMLLNKERFQVYAQHESGIFSDPKSGNKIENITFFGKKSIL